MATNNIVIDIFSVVSGDEEDVVKSLESWFYGHDIDHKIKVIQPIISEETLANLSIPLHSINSMILHSMLEQIKEVLTDFLLKWKRITEEE